MNETYCFRIRALTFKLPAVLRGCSIFDRFFLWSPISPSAKISAIFWKTTIFGSEVVQVTRERNKSYNLPQQPLRASAVNMTYEAASSSLEPFFFIDSQTVILFWTLISLSQSMMECDCKKRIFKMFTDIQKIVLQ